MNKEMKEIIEKIESLGWSVYIDEVVVTLGKFSSAGQDFNIVVDLEEDVEDFIENIYNCYENFDVSYETSLWIDNEGHGINGAPYDMKDVYEDMEECKEFIYELYQDLKNR